jgi:hypothetical protein
MLLIISVNANANKVYEGNNCINYSRLIYVLEFNRINDVDKKQLIEEITKSNNDKTIKDIWLSNIDLIYNTPKGYGYSNSIYNRCLRKGKIIFNEI